MYGEWVHQIEMATNVEKKSTKQTNNLIKPTSEKKAQ